MQALVIREYRQQDAKAVTDLLYDTIHHIGPAHYSAAQVNAWTPLPRDYRRWRERLAQWPPLIAEPGGQLGWGLSP